VVGENVQFFAENGVRGVFEEGASVSAPSVTHQLVYQTASLWFESLLAIIQSYRFFINLRSQVTAGDGADMAELKNYVLAEMLWNPAQDPAVLIDEFLRGFFGADGAQYVRAHMDNVHRSMQAAGCNSTANSYSDGCLNSCCDYPPGESIRWAVAASRCHV
jgi:hypothetical protein